MDIGYNMCSWYWIYVVLVDFMMNGMLQAEVRMRKGDTYYVRFQTIEEGFVINHFDKTYSNEALAKIAAERYIKTGRVL